MDATAEQFHRTGVIWEYYHSELSDQEQVARKPQTPYNLPCRDYLDLSLKGALPLWNPESPSLRFGSHALSSGRPAA